MPSLQHFLLGVFLLLLFTAPGHQASADQDPELQRILKAHVDAMGGWRAWNKVESIRLTGTIEREGQTYDFCIIKKRPDQIRATITMSLPGNKDEEIQLIRAYDGKKAWTASRMAGSDELSLTPLDDESRKDLIEDAALLPKLVHLWQSGADLQLLGTGTVGGRTAYKIQATQGESDFEYLMHVDKDTYQLMEYSIVRGGDIFSTTRLSGFASFSEVLLPQNMTIESKETGSSQMHVAGIEVGVGIYRDYFQE